ncbi:MAG TPA: dienelactone hydrolase family protein [Rhizomicrobium sp.]|nr:dienelactone hydrolase family protein [Rhizomicrobium sp.]
MDKDFAAPVTRRVFAATGLVAGFTLATGPLNAAAIITDANGLDAGEVSIPVSDGKIPGYRAKPSGKANLPVVLVVQEVFGVHEHIRDICRRFAHQGYYAIAPSLYARQGDPGKYDMDHLKELFSDIVSKVPDAEVMSDLDSAVAFASGDGGDASQLGITGFCWGGRIVWLYVAHNPKVKAGVAFYGGLRSPSPVSPLRPKYPLDLAADINAPVLAFYGGQDMGIKVADIEEMRSALHGAGKTNFKLELFPDAQHGFFADYRPSYNEKDAKQAWSEMLAWFRKYV